jgi:IMP dehydrogenase
MPSGKLLGIVTSRDYRISKDGRDKKVKDFMTPFENLITAKNGVSLSEANDIIWEHKLNTLPVELHLSLPGFRHLLKFILQE